MPYLAVPLVLAGMSSCGTDLPIKTYWSGCLQLDGLELIGRPDLVGFAARDDLRVGHELVRLGVTHLQLVAGTRLPARSASRRQP